MTPRELRLEALEALREARGSDVLIAYVTSTRPGFTAIMAPDAIRRFADHVPEEQVERIDLFLHTDGGESTVPWRLMTYLREYAETIDVLVPVRAFSAGTVTALGADHVVMHPIATLGPIDPTVTDPYSPRDDMTGQPLGVGVEDVAAYIAMVKDDFGFGDDADLTEVFKLLTERVHPLTLGHVKRGTQQARMLGEKLLKSRRDPPADEDIQTLLDELTRRLFFHGHPINRREAADLGFPVVIPTPDIEAAMWDLYLEYEADMNLLAPFEVVSAAVDAGGQLPKSGLGQPVNIPQERRVIIESATQADVYTLDAEILLGRRDDGGIIGNFAVRQQGWSIES